MGDPAQLAAIAAKQYHNHSFLGRHPIFTFLVLPLPLILLCIIAICSSLFGSCYVVYLLAGSPTINGLNHPYLSNIVLTVFSWLLLVFPPITIALFTCRVARRNNLNWRWAWATCMLHAVYVGLFQAVCTLPKKPNSHDGQFMVGFGFDSSFHGICMAFLPKFALAMGIGLLLIKRAQHLQKIHEISTVPSAFRQAA